MENSTKKGQVALKAGIWYVVSSIIVRAIGFITTPIFTRLMSTAEYGTVQTFTSWYTLLLPIFTLNLTYSIGRAKIDYPGKLNEYMGSMQLLASLTSFGLGCLIIVFISPVSGILELTKIESILLLAYLFFHIPILMRQSFYRFSYLYKQNIAISWYSALSSTIFSIVLLLVCKGDKADLRIIGLTLPTVFLSLFYWITSIKEKSLKVNNDYWKYALRISVPLILHTIAMHILSQSDRLFITKIWGKSETAFYSLAYTFGALFNILITAISEGWLPWFHDTYHENDFAAIRKNVKPLIILGCYVGLACVAFAPEAVMILGGIKYQNSILCVPPIAIGVVVQYVYSHYVNIELHLKKTMYVSAGTIVAAVFNIITNAIFIPQFGYIAAAYTSLASYFILLLIHFAVTRYILKIKIYNDVFMFGSLLVTGMITTILIWTYKYRVIRYIFSFAGFVSFVFYFRYFYINLWLKRKDLKQF